MPLVSDKTKNGGDIKNNKEHLIRVYYVPGTVSKSFTFNYKFTAYLILKTIL